MQSFNENVIASDNLRTKGFEVWQCHPDKVEFDAVATQFGREVGAKSIGVKELVGDGSSELMTIHYESITQKADTALKYFALGCLQKAEFGGNTLVYDGRLAARDILENHAALAGVVLHYHSTVYEGQEECYPLVLEDGTDGPVMRYRSRESTNRIVDDLPNGISEDDFYHTVDGVVKDALVADHEWQDGEFVIVNNQFTLHSRAPYSGKRRMLRYRYDDPHFKHILLGEA